MSTPPLPPPGSGSGTSTQEIPVVPAAVANTQHLPPPPTAAAASSGDGEPDPMRTTGPVDFVPEPPGATASTEKVPFGGSRRVVGARSRGLVPVGFAVLALVCLELGLSLAFGSRSFWSAVPLWSAFATVVAVGGTVAVAGHSLGGRAGAWRIAAGALAGLAVFWLLVVLPVADTDRGFLLTAALGLLGAAVWLTAGRNLPRG